MSYEQAQMCESMSTVGVQIHILVGVLMESDN